MESKPISAIDACLEHNARFAAGRSPRELPGPPARQLAVVACMDARLDPAAVLGLAEGDAHVIRNAGGVVSDDILRSLVISQRLLGTREVMLVHHTGCGMLSFTDAELEREIERETGERPPFPMLAFADLEASVRRSVARIAESPFLPHRDAIRGFVYELESGRLREVR